MRNYLGQLATTFFSLLAITAPATVRYVDVASANAAPPYTSWSSAATNIQDAIDAANPGDQILVTNGIYQAGERILSGPSTNRLVVDKAVKVQSVNGPPTTLIDGFNAMRCVYLADGSALAGFTLTNGLAPLLLTSTNAMSSQGAGSYCESINVSVSNCVFTSNSADIGGGVHGGILYNSTLTGNSAGLQGGGADSATMNNCTLTGNLSDNYGGGASYSVLNNCALMNNHAFDGGGALSCTLNNCTLLGNSAGIAGGGAHSSTLNNCIAYYNIGPQANYSGSTLSYCCTTPLPAGTDNIDSPPLFVDPPSGNLRLQCDSPCINAGRNLYASSTDLDGHPRIIGGTVDIGAFEFQTPHSILSYAWAQRFGLPTDGSADYTDADGDGMNNWQEWIAGTDPTNALSVLKMLTPGIDAYSVTLSWQSVTGRTYCLQRSTSLSAQPTFLKLSANIAGQAGTTTYTDNNAVGNGPFFYRVSVQQ